MEGSWGKIFNFSRALRLAPPRLIPTRTASIPTRACSVGGESRTVVYFHFEQRHQQRHASVEDTDTALLTQSLYSYTICITRVLSVAARPYVDGGWSRDTSEVHS